MDRLTRVTRERDEALARERVLREALREIESHIDRVLAFPGKMQRQPLLDIREIVAEALLAQPAAGEAKKVPGKISTRRIYNGIVHEMADRGAGTMCGLELPEPWTYTDDSVNCGACRAALAVDPQPAEAGGEETATTDAYIPPGWQG